VRNPDFIIKIAADSVNRLRGVDVFRVLDDCSKRERKVTARYIVEHRPELAGEINAYWNEVLPMEVHGVDSDCVVSPGTGLCVICGVGHDETCPTCAGRGFHAADCIESDANWQGPLEQSRLNR
jgi:hypothetical protein